MTKRMKSVYQEPIRNERCAYCGQEAEAVTALMCVGDKSGSYKKLFWLHDNCWKDWYLDRCKTQST